MSVYEMAKKYYPLLWNKSRIDALIEAGRLTEDEAKEIVCEISHEMTPDGSE